MANPPRPWGWAVWAAVGWGAGLSPYAPGTMGTVWGVGLAWLLKRLLPPGAEIAVAVGLCLAAVGVCGRAEKFFGVKDDRRIVADEYATFPLCVLGLPAAGWLWAWAFLTHRAFDVIKPWPARRFQRLPGGWGIVLDDVVASLYALAANWACYALAVRWGYLA